MVWATPQYSRGRVDAAGQVLISDHPTTESLDEALIVINNWRSSHSFPLNTFQTTLRRKARQVSSDCLIAQRIKRLSSIELKLRLLGGMKLSRMQDIGGCRVVLPSVGEVEALVRLYERSDLKHVLDHKDDYITYPKTSGYRGVHLVYRYRSDKTTTWNGLRLEMQIRSTLQHAWATAVETVGTFIRQALKSSQGEGEWLRFFALMGGALAIREGSPLPPGTPRTERALVTELRQHARRLDVESKLAVYGEALQTLEQPSAQRAHYFLLKLDPARHEVTVQGYKARELDMASQMYLFTEREIEGHPGAEAVLVSVESLSALRRAYPNYFLDTRVFIDALKEAIA